MSPPVRRGGACPYGVPLTSLWKKGGGPLAVEGSIPQSWPRGGSAMTAPFSKGSLEAVGADALIGPRGGSGVFPLRPGECAKPTSYRRADDIRPYGVVTHKTWCHPERQRRIPYLLQPTTGSFASRTLEILGGLPLRSSMPFRRMTCKATKGCACFHALQSWTKRRASSMTRALFWIFTLRQGLEPASTRSLPLYSGLA